MGKAKTNLQKPEVVKRMLGDETLTAEELRVWIAVAFTQTRALNMPKERMQEIAGRLMARGYIEDSPAVIRGITDYILESYMARYKIKPSWGTDFFVVLTRRMVNNSYEPQLIKEAWDVWMGLEKGAEMNHHPKVWISEYWFDFCLVEAIKRRERRQAHDKPRTREQLEAHQARKYTRRGVRSGDDTPLPGNGLCTLQGALSAFLQSENEGNGKGPQTQNHKCI